MRYEHRGQEFSFGELVVMEAVLIPDADRIGRLVQIRKGAGAFGSDIFIIRRESGALITCENVWMRKANDATFEDSYSRVNGKEPPPIPDIPLLEQDTQETEYSIADKYPETGFIIEQPKQPDSPTQSFGMIITKGGAE